MLMKTKGGALCRITGNRYTYVDDDLSFDLAPEDGTGMAAVTYRLSELLPADKLSKYLFDIEQDMSYDTDRKGESNE